MGKAIGYKYHVPISCDARPLGRKLFFLAQRRATTRKPQEKQHAVLFLVLQTDETAIAKIWEFPATDGF